MRCGHCGYYRQGACWRNYAIHDGENIPFGKKMSPSSLSCVCFREVRIAGRRTNIEVIYALIAKLNEGDEEEPWSFLKFNEAGTALLFFDPVPGEGGMYFYIADDGTLFFGEVNDHIPAVYMPALAEACMEIHGNRQAKDKRIADEADDSVEDGAKEKGCDR